MSTNGMEVARYEPPQVQVITGAVEFNPDQVQLLKDTVCKGATNDELKLFVEVCRSKKLDPFAKQIHAVKRWDSTLKREAMSFQTGIDGFRLIAERTGKYEGQDEPLWCGKDGIWKDVWMSNEPPIAAKATIYRKGFTKPMTRIAHYREYVQTNREGHANSMWSKMPANQLHKCAEALSFRAAFPEELSGIYTNDEMGQADARDARDAKADKLPDTGGNPPNTQAAADHVAQQKIEELKRQQEQRRAETKPTPPAEKIPEDVQSMWAQMKDITSTLKVFASLKKNLCELLGQDGGERFYYGTLGKNGVEHANQFKSTKPARIAARELLEAIQGAQQPPVMDETDLPDFDHGDAPDGDAR